MIAVLGITFPLYMIIGLGYGAARFRFLSADDLRATGRVVMRVAMPAMIFISIGRIPISESFRWDFLLGYLGGSLTVFCAGLLLLRRGLGQPMPASVLGAMGMSCSNSAFMGFPIAAMVLGDTALQAFAMAMLVENIVMMPLAIMLGDRAMGGQADLLRGTLRGMIRNPLLLAVAAGVIFSLSGLVLPPPLERTLLMLAPVAPPVALLVVGGAVASLPFARLAGPMLWVVAGKLLLHPLAVLGALYLTGPMPADLMLSGVLIASVPMMSIYALFGQRWGEETLAASTLILATAVSFATVSAMLFILGRT